MKIKELAVENLSDILSMTDGGTFLSNTRRNAWVAEKMRDKGWKTVTVDNIVAVADTLGFPVVGETIYNTDE